MPMSKRKPNSPANSLNSGFDPVPRALTDPIEVHLWFVPLNGDATARAAALALLNPVEKGQAARFHFDRDRDRYIFSHAALRKRLGAQLAIHPAAVQFSIGSTGKPHLTEPAAPIRFNLSHAGDYALIGLTTGPAIGVDLESLDRKVEYDDVVAQFFSVAEQIAWREIPPLQRSNTFLRGWTRKEAYVKARGDGLSHASTSYTVDLSEIGRQGLIADELDPTAPNRFHLRTVTAPVTYAAACCVNCPPNHPLEFTIH